MRQPGWRWAWAGRASLEGRPGSMVLRVLVYTSQVTGAHFSCYAAGPAQAAPGALPVSIAQGGHCSSACCTTLTLALGCRRNGQTLARFVALWALTGCTPSRYLLGASCPGCIRRQLPVCRLHRAPVARCSLSYVDWVHSQSYIACQAQVARLHMQQWSGVLLPQAYATTHNIPRLGALPGLRRRRKHSWCQHHFASIYAIWTAGLTPQLECILRCWECEECVCRNRALTEMAPVDGCVCAYVAGAY